MSFAAGTSVAVDKTKLELERLLIKHGAKQYGNAFDEESGLAIVYFKLAERHIRLQIPVPPLTDWPDPSKPSYSNKKKTPRTWDRMGVESRTLWVRAQWEQASRTRWRQMLLIVKAKLEHVALGLSQIEREFLADITLPDGRSIAELLKPQIAQVYLDGTMPPLLTSRGAAVVDAVEEP